MTGNVRVGLLAIAFVALSAAGMNAQGPPAGQKPPDTKPEQKATADAQAKPADAKPDAAQEELPADFKAFNDAGKEKDLLKRVEAYEKFMADHPTSRLVATARAQIQSTLLATLKTAQTKYLDVMRQQIETAKSGESASTLSSTYSRLASSLLTANVLLDQAEEYARSALSSMDEAKFIQERRRAAEQQAEAAVKRAATPPATPPAGAPPNAPAPATPPAAAPAPPSRGGGFTISMIDGVPFARPAPPRSAAPAAAAARPATPPAAPRVPTDDEIRTTFRAEKASVQATLGQILLKRGKTAEGEAMLKEAYAARPAAAAMATIARALAGSAKKAGDDAGQLEYLMALALAGRITADEQKDLEALYRKTHNESLDGLDEALDTRYVRTAPKFEVKPSTRVAKSTDRAVLAEMFTGAG